MNSAQHAVSKLAVSVVFAGLSGLAMAGPQDGPVLAAQEIVISGTINGAITNGEQGSSWKKCAWFVCTSGSSSTTFGQLNVNGIVQQGNVVLQANKIVLHNDVTHDIHNKEGTLNYKGIMQIGR